MSNKLRICILTISDRSARGERDDASGPVLQQKVLDQNWEVKKSDIVPDDVNTIKNLLSNWADRGECDVILTTGGTGFSARDITPEATRAVVDRLAPGLAEAMRAASIKITPHAMLSRSIAGIRKRTLIVNLPGSPKAAVENFDVISSVLPHAVQLLQDDPKSEIGHLA
jgi:molybdenum cofactor synthesis domain-containing protein